MAITGNPQAQVSSPNRAPTIKAWSVACWAKAAAVPGVLKYSNAAYIQTNAPNAIGTIYLAWDNNPQPFSAIGVGDGPTYPYVSFGTYPSLNTWVHLAAVFTGSSLVAYRNGVSVGSAAMNVAATPTGISARFANSMAYNASGTVADGGAWNAALTADEVAAMGLDMISAGAIRRPALFAFFPLIRDQVDAHAVASGGVGNTASDHPRIFLP